MLSRILENHGRQVIATDFEIATIRGSHEDGTDHLLNPRLVAAHAKIIGEQATQEEAYRIGRNSALGALAAVATVSLVVGAGVWAEKTGRMDWIPAESRADFGMKPDSSVSVEMPPQFAPTDVRVVDIN